MKTVRETAALAGVSVRTLHHYDAIGLLKPTRVTEAGYRLYDAAALRRLQAIVLLRELEFPLKEIREILDRPDFDPAAALEDQIRLLELRRDRLDRLIAHARQIQTTGGYFMDFSLFDRSEVDAYAAEARRRWGNTDAYQEYVRMAKNRTRAETQAEAGALMDIFREFGAIRVQDPAGAGAQALVAKLQTFITEHYYTCTKPILRGLGQMYVAGDSMTENIDKAGGEGTAAFVNAAIVQFCTE